MPGSSFAIAIHGGAGNILQSAFDEARTKLYKDAMKRCIYAGYEILENHGTAEEAVIASVIELENEPLFNAGKGSVFCSDETHEMDAAIMTGDLSCGAVTLITNVKNPILLAKAVKDKTPHILLAGKSAEQLAAKENLELAGKDYFFTQQRYDQLISAQQDEKISLDHSEQGTVGAAACDSSGSVAAATSTGGMTNKMPGRIGDSPLIGSGTYADNSTCAVSCTGKGEAFIKTAAAYDVSALMKYKSISLADACRLVINKLNAIRGEGGLIAVNNRADIAVCFNSSGMHRACIDKHGNFTSSIF